MREFWMKRGQCCSWFAGITFVFGIFCASFIAHGANEKQIKEPVVAEEELPPVGWADLVENYLTFREESWPMVVPASEGEVFGSWDSIIANIGKRIVCGWFWYFQDSQVRLEKGALPGQEKPEPIEVVVYEDIYNSRVVMLGMAEGEKPRELYSEKTIPLLSSLEEGFPPEAEISMRRIAVRFTALPHDYVAPKEEASFLKSELFVPLLRMMGGEDATNKIWLELEHGEQDQINTVGLTVHIPAGTFSNVDVFYNTNLLDSAACELVCASQAVNAEGILSLSFGTTNVGMGFYRATNAEEDSDGDGLLDGRERWLYLTRPDLADTDGDGDSDGREVEFGTDPLDSRDYFGVVINAIQPYPPAPGVENYREWVELFNSGRDAVSLDGFRLETARPAGWTNVFTFPYGVTLDPGDFLVVGNSSNGDFVADLLLPNSTYTPPSVFGLRLLPPASARVADAVFYGYTNDFDFSLEGFGNELPILRPAQGGVIRRTWIGFDTDHAGDWIQVEGALWPPHLQGEHLDLDGDGLSNAEELENGVFPLEGGTQLTVADTDGDGMSDFDEMNYEWNQVPAPLNPNDVDTDGDAFPWSELSLPEGNDANEIANGSNPTVYDTDGDGIPDGWEIAGGLDPNSPDSDNDSDSDGDEDTDEDGIPNGVEVAQLSNPFPPFGAASRTPNNYLMLYNGGAFTCRSEGDIGYGTILTYDVVATSNCPPFLVEIREGGGEAEAYSVECGAVCGLIRAYEENVTGQTVRVRVYAVEPMGQTAFQFSIIDGLTTWTDENPESLGADISICHGGIENDLERPELPEVDEESVGFNIANKTAHPDAQRKQLLIHPPSAPFDALTGVVLTYDPKLLLYDAAEGGNVIASGSIIPIASLSTNVYAEGITASGGMRDAWIETTPYEVELPDRINATVLQANLGDPGILPYKPWHTNAPRNALQLLQTQPTAWDGLMQLNLTGSDVFSSPSGGTPMTLPLTFTNQLLASTVYLETDSASGGRATFHVVGLDDCIAKRELQVLGVNATLDGLAETDEESPGAFIADRSAHPNASRTQLTLEAITPTNPPGDCTLTWDTQAIAIYPSPSGGSPLQLNGYDNEFYYSPFTNQTFYIEGKTSGVSTITFASGSLQDVINVTIIRVDIEQSETNTCWRAAQAAVNLSGASYLGGGDLVWTCTNAGLGNVDYDNNHYEFSPSNSIPDRYVVKARSSLVSDCYDTCAVQVIKVEIEQSETNVCRDCSSPVTLNLTPDSFLGLGGSTIWTWTNTTLGGVTHNNTSFQFTPTNSAPDRYVVTARPSILPNCFDTCTVRVIKVELRELSFTNNHTIKSDDGMTDYTAPHWNDPNGDGNVADGHSFPLCFTRNTKMVLSLGNWHIEPPDVPLTIQIKGDGPGSLDFQETAASLNGNDLTISNLECAANFANEVDFFDPMTISWEFSIDGGANWCNAGKSTNISYITWDDPEQATPIQTLVEVGCDAANGQGGTVGINDDDVLEAIWTIFQTKSIQRASDSCILTYYGFYDANSNGTWDVGIDTDLNDPGSCGITDAEGLILSANGQCHSWADFMNEVMKTQGLSTVNSNSSKRVAVVIKAGDVAFSVKNWAKTGSSPRTIIDADAGVDGTISTIPNPANNEAADAMGVVGQGNSPNPPSHFGNHWIIKINGKLYDPSYGLGPYIDYKTYETDAFEGAITQVGSDYFLQDAPADNSNPMDHSDEINDYTELVFP